MGSLQLQCLKIVASRLDVAPEKFHPPPLTDCGNSTGPRHIDFALNSSLTRYYRTVGI
jgi:hypothetical protein